jgi:hypothetical protein
MKWVGLLLLATVSFLGINSLKTRKSLREFYRSRKLLYSSGNCSLRYLRPIFREMELHQRIMLTTPCLSLDRLGNSLSLYLESRICANISGLHFISLINASASAHIMSYLPEVIYHDNQMKGGLMKAKGLCICNNICHENPLALIHSHGLMVRDMLRPVILQYYANVMSLELKSPSIDQLFWKSRLRSPYFLEPTSLPDIPEVSIHYRCGDNTIKSYGFLSFPAFRNRIPPNVSTIYVLAESQSRNQAHREEHCTTILSTLLDYLSEQFPSTSIGIFRGGSVGHDFARLSLSKILICSVSTFCLYAALASTETVYLPVTTLFANATKPSYAPNIHWLDQFPDESILLGRHSVYLNGLQIEYYLRNPVGTGIFPPMVVARKDENLIPLCDQTYPSKKIVEHS